MNILSLRPDHYYYYFNETILYSLKNSNVRHLVYFSYRALILNVTIYLLLMRNMLYNLLTQIFSRIFLMKQFYILSSFYVLSEGCTLQRMHLCSFCNFRVLHVNFVWPEQVSQIRTTNEELPFHVINLAVGTELSFPVTYRDALGIIKTICT